MRFRPIIIGLATLLVSTFILLDTINVQADKVNPTSEIAIQEPIVPAAVFERLGHPDIIYTIDGIFEKSQQSLSEISQDEVTYDSSKTTDKTKVIIAYDATYVKLKENN